jgi:pyrroline-5-carboxylate reductase
MKIGVIGTGTIASAVVDGIAADGHQIMVSARSATHAARLAAAYDTVVIAENQAVLDGSDVIFLGLMADAAPAILQDLTFRPDHRVISLMVGLAAHDVEALIAPALLEAQVIPFPAIATGGSPVLACPDTPLVTEIFARNNTVIGLKDAEALTPYLAAQALLSPVLRQLAGAADWMAARTGDRHRAEQFLRLLIGGGLMAQPIEAADVLNGMIADLNTPGGLNAELREFLADHGTYDALNRGLDQLEHRLKSG